MRRAVFAQIIKLQEVFDTVMYRKILESYFSGYSQRIIASSVGSSCRAISNVIKRRIEDELIELTHEMTDEWLDGLLSPEKQPVEKGYAPLQLDWIHAELKKKGVNAEFAS